MRTLSTHIDGMADKAREILVHSLRRARPRTELLLKPARYSLSLSSLNRWASARRRRCSASQRWLFLIRVLH